jgi:hypothetical protein
MADEKNFDGPSVSQITVPTASKTTSVAYNNTEDDDEDITDEEFSLGFHDDGTLTVEAFRVGTHTDSGGNTATWTEKDVKEIAEKGNAQLKDKPVPVVIGHPDDKAPAYGWVEKFKVVGNKVRAKLNQLNEAFVNGLKSGAYKGRSISLYDDNRVRHIGFLGGSQPAIEGLQPLKFEEAQKTRIYDFNEEIQMADYTEKDINFLYKLLSRFGLDIQKSKEKPMADKVTTPVPATAPAFAEVAGVTKSIKDAEAGGQTAAPASANDAALKAKEEKDPGPEAVAKIETAKAKAAESEEQTENADLKNQLAALISRIESLESALAKNHSEATATIAKATIETTEAKAKVEELKAEIVEQSVNQFVESLVKDGKLRPADVEMTLMALDAQIVLDATPVYNMSENKDEKKVSRLEQYKAKLLAMPKIVEFGSFPNLPGAQSPASFPAAVTAESMGSYIENKMCSKMAEQDKLGLTTKTSYWETMKGAHAEASKEFPSEYKEYVSKTMMPGMPGR